MSEEIKGWALAGLHALKRWELAREGSREQWDATQEYRECQKQVLERMGGNHHWNEARR